MKYLSQKITAVIVFFFGIAFLLSVVFAQSSVSIIKAAENIGIGSSAYIGIGSTATFAPFKADLIPVALSVAPTAKAGQPISVSWTVKNQGNREATHSSTVTAWEDRVYIASSSAYDNTAFYLGRFKQTASVAAGNSYTATVNAPLSGKLSGNYYLILRVDNWNDVAESNNNNNQKVIPITIFPNTGIIVDKNSVEVILDKANAQSGFVYGEGFKITSIDADGWELYNNEGTQGYGFYDASGGIVPGRIDSIRTYINTNLPTGIYSGSVKVRYSKNYIWYDGPTVTYKITLKDSTASASAVGDFGKAVNLNGNVSIPQYVQIPHTNSLNPYYKNFTVEAWIKPELPSLQSGLYNREFGRIISKSSGSANSYDLSYASYIMPDNKVHYSYEFSVADQKIGCAMATVYSDNGTVNDKNGKPINGATVPREQLSNWKHVAGVIREGNLYIYENGELIAKNEYNIQEPCANTNTLQIGARSLSAGNGNQDGFFRGIIDEVRISDLSRYPEDWVNTYKPFIKNSGTIGLWHLDGNIEDDSHNNLPAGKTVGPVKFVDSLKVFYDGVKLIYQ